MILEDVRLSDAVHGPKYLKKVRRTWLNVNERSSRWFTAAIHDFLLLHDVTIAD